MPLNWTVVKIKRKKLRKLKKNNPFPPKICYHYSDHYTTRMKGESV